MTTAIDNRMEVCDCLNSYMHFQIDVRKKPPRSVSHQPPFTLNHVRVPLECRLVVEDRRDGRRHEFCLTANCKTERVNVERDVWTQPNADVHFVVNAGRLLILKAFDHCGRKVMLHPPTLGEQPHRQVIEAEESLDQLRVDLRCMEGQVLTTNERILAAIESNRALASRTVIERGPYRAVIEYPIKTVNGSPRDGFYQTDTGPILLPDLDREADDLIHGLDLAYVAHNSPHWAEFIVRRPTAITDDVRVEHFAHTVRLESIHNEVIAAGDDWPHIAARACSYR